MSGSPLLEVRNLNKHYPITEGLLKNEVGRVRAVDGIDFEVDRGETLGIVGESGCGKSTAASSLLRLEEPTSGTVLFDGEDITEYDDAELKRFRRRAQMIFQDPSASFDPRMSIGESVAEPLRIHGINDRERRRTIVQNLLERMGLPRDAVDRYPHEFSGGQKQRMALARALIVNPDLIVADEPTSALDVSIQAEILQLVNEIQDEFDLSIVFISHDMGIVREVCDRVAVMYLGEIVELAPTEELFTNPQHPYSEALLSSIPQPDPRERSMGVELSGDVPSPSDPPTGCRFHTRCHRIIQPEDYEFEQKNWRAVMDLRDRLENRNIDLEAAREFAAVETDVELESVDDDLVADVLRDEFGIPETLDDPGAESVLGEALSAICARDLERADDLLAEEFETACEMDIPQLREVDTDRLSACHLEGWKDDDVTAPLADD